jgi:hypothetical protein
MKVTPMFRAGLLWLALGSPVLATTYGSVGPIATPDVIDTGILRAQRLEVRAAVRLRVRGTDVQPPLVILAGQAVEMVVAAVAEGVLQPAEGVGLVLDAEVLLAGLVGALEGLQQLGQRPAPAAQEVEQLREREQPRVGVEVLPKVVVARELAAQDGVARLHRLLD